MTMTITAEQMTSDQTAHWAAPTAPGRPYGTWAVSWLTGRALTRNQAITAMTLAEFAAQCLATPGGRYWPHVHSWAAELGLSGEDAARLASRIPPVEARPAVDRAEQTCDVVG